MATQEVTTLGQNDDWLINHDFTINNQDYVEAVDISPYGLGLIGLGQNLNGDYYIGGPQANCNYLNTSEGACNSVPGCFFVLPDDHFPNPAGIPCHLFNQ